MQTIANKAMTIVDSLVWQMPHVWKSNCQWHQKVPMPKSPFFLDRFLKQKENTCVNKSWKLSFLDRCCLHDTFNFTKKYQHHVPAQCFCFCVYWHWTTRGCCVKHGTTFSTWKKPHWKPWDWFKKYHPRKHPRMTSWKIMNEDDVFPIEHEEFPMSFFGFHGVITEQHLQSGSVDLSSGPVFSISLCSWSQLVAFFGHWSFLFQKPPRRHGLFQFDQLNGCIGYRQFLRSEWWQF